MELHTKSCWQYCFAGSSKKAPRIMTSFNCHVCHTFLLAKIHCYLSTLKCWHNNSLLRRPFVGPQIENPVASENTDGLMAFFITNYKPKMTTSHKDLLLAGHKDKRRVLLICHKNKWCDLWHTLVTFSYHYLNPKRPGLFGLPDTRMGDGIHPFWET